MGLKFKEINHLLIRQLKLTANEPVIAKSLGYGIAHIWQDMKHLKPSDYKPASPDIDMTAYYG